MVTRKLWQNFFYLGLFAMLPTVLGCLGGCSGCECNRCAYGCDNYSPTFISCQSHIGTFTAESWQIVASSWQLTARVCWTEPTATDNCCMHSVTKISETSSCSYFPEGWHSVEYRASDCQYNHAYCRISFEVQVVRCPFLNSPLHMKSITYSRGINQQPILGDTARFVCERGYVLTKPATQTCTSNGKWSEGGVYYSHTCRAITCPSVVPLPNTIVVTSYSNGYTFQSLAFVQCTKELTIIEGRQYVQCLDDGSWSAVEITCEDKRPPVIHNCPRTIEAVADRNATTTRITWQPPFATDNYDDNISITIVGREPGSIFHESAESYYVEYNAVDAAGNRAVPCSFAIRVFTLLCNISAMQLSRHMWKKCPNSPRWGATCQLGCYDEYPLIGQSTVTCEAVGEVTYWDWIMNEVSYCRELQCPLLSPPLHGALACSTWNNGPICQLQCNDEYALPELAASLFYCSTLHGTWMPSDVFDCTEKIFPDGINNILELSYFYGHCSNTSSLLVIQENFIQILKASVARSVCLNVTSCSVNNVNVTCGTGSRSKRNIDKLHISLDINMQLSTVSLRSNWTLLHTTLQNITNEMIAIINNEISKDVFSRLHFSGFGIDKNSFQSIRRQLICPSGTQQRWEDFTCVPCAQGSFYNSQHEKCDACPIGTYQNYLRQTVCTICPHGTTTKFSGSTKITDCVDKQHISI